MVVRKLLAVILLFGLSCHNVKSNRDTDFDSLKKIIVEHPENVKKSDLKLINNDNTNKFIPEIYTFKTSNYLGTSPEYKMYYAFITQPSNIKFVLSNSEDGKIPLKVSFSKDASIYFGESYKLLTEKSPNKELDYLKKSDFINPNPQFTAEYFIKYGTASYYDFVDHRGAWYIHHIFDVSNIKAVKYYIAYSIYTLDDSFVDDDKDGILDFKQKYDYSPNSEDKSLDKFRVYSLK